MLSSLNAVIWINERNWILTGHVIFKLRYNQIYQLKTTLDKKYLDLVQEFIFKAQLEIQSETAC